MRTASRSSFRDWAAERTDHLREVIEAALAHVVPNKVEAAYARSDLFERRLLLMDDWAKYLQDEGGPATPRCRAYRMRTVKRRAGPVAHFRGLGSLADHHGPDVSRGPNRRSADRSPCCWLTRSVAASWFRLEYLTRASTFRVTDLGVADCYKWVQ